MSEFTSFQFVLPLPEMVRLAKLIAEVSTDTLNDEPASDWTPEELRSAYGKVLAPSSLRKSSKYAVMVPAEYVEEMFGLLDRLTVSVESGKVPSKRLLRQICSRFENLPREASDPDLFEDGIWTHLGILSRI